MKFYHKLIFILAAITGIVISGCRKESPIDLRDLGRIRVDSLSQNILPAGAYLEVYGDNFTFNASDVSATIGNTKLLVIDASVNKLLLKLPDNATSGSLTLHFNRAQSSLPNSADFMENTITTSNIQINPTAVPRPILLSVAPVSGNAGRTITIKGYNFSQQHDPQVWFGMAKGDRIAVSDTTITVKVPTAAIVGGTTISVAQSTFRSNSVSFDVLKPLPEVDAVYFSMQGNIYVSQNTNDVFAAKLLYDIAATSFPYPLRMDASRQMLYWLDQNNAEIVQAPTSGIGPLNTIYSYATENNIPIDFSIDKTNNKLYMVLLEDATGETGVFELDINGTGNAKKLYGFPTESPAIVKPGAAKGKLYWVETLPVTKVVSADINGSGNKSTIYQPSADERIESMDIDDTAGKLYMIIYISNGQKQLVQVDLLDGKNPKVITTDIGLSSLWVDKSAGLIYWNSSSSGRLYRSDVSGSFIEMISADIASAETITVKHK